MLIFFGAIWPHLICSSGTQYSRGPALSVLAEIIGPIVSTISIVIVLTILSEQDPLYDEHVKPYLFTSHMLAWKGFFYSKATQMGP